MIGRGETKELKFRKTAPITPFTQDLDISRSQNYDLEILVTKQLKMDSYEGAP